MPITYYTEEDVERERIKVWEHVLARVDHHQRERLATVTSPASALYALRKELVDWWYKERPTRPR